MTSPGRFVLAVLTVALLAVSSLALAEDVVVVFKTHGPEGEGTATQYFSAQGTRSTEGERDMLFDYESETITNIDHDKKEYSQITLAEIEQAMEAMSAQMAEAQAKMEALPAAMRERMAKMMGGLGGDVTLTKGGTREVAGYTTQEYTLTMGDTMTMTLWNTTDLELPVPGEVIKKLTAFTGPMAAMASNPMFKGFGQLAEKMRETEGLTLANQTSVSLMGRSSETSREATEVRMGSIPASDLDVGALTSGYKKVDAPLAQVGKR